MHVEVLVWRELALTIGQICETPPEVKEQWIGVDPGISTKVELHPVAGTEVDEFREPGEAGEFDQVLPREIHRQSGGRELIDLQGAI
jgi:hypothetical protein